MAATRYERVKASLTHALALNSAERREFLGALDQTDPDVSDQVRSLLDHEDSASPAVDSAWLGSVFGRTGAERGTAHQLGRYLILKELGRGGSGIVYLAQDPTLDRRVALKVLPRHVSLRPANLERFREEARALAAVHHPNIATIHDLDVDHDPPFLCQEFIDGETLAHRLGSGEIELDEAVRISREIAVALETAHHCGVVHGDLKPANILLTQSGTAKVVDFGLASRSDGASTQEPGVAEGTPGYMSPEQVDGRRLDHRTDIWSFGCVLFECISGVPACGAGSISDRIDRTRRGEIEWTALPESVSVRLRAVLERCLIPDRASRWATMVSVREELDEHCLQASDGHDSIESSRRSLPAARPNLPRIVDRFFGRREQLAKITDELTRRALITLCGSGGCGKTRLALETAHRIAKRYPGGVWILDLAPLPTRARLAEEAARAMGLAEDPERTPRERVAAAMKGRPALLLLDNCEHLRDEAAEFTGNVLQDSEDVTVLATSREALGLEGEIAIAIPPLAVTVDTDTGLRQGQGQKPDRGQGQDGDTDRSPGVASGPEETEPVAVQLFLDRARAANPDLDVDLSPMSRDRASVHDICMRLEGIPLAIELAAARTRVMTVQEIAARLAERFALLGSVASSSRPVSSSGRHRSLYDSIDWTFRLLSPAERSVFRRLALFRGGWTLRAAEAVASDGEIKPWDVLPAFVQLVDKSLVQREAGPDRNRSRYRMFETVREFARHRLEEAEEVEATARRMTSHFVATGEEARENINGPAQAEWVARLDADAMNLRQTLRMNIDQDGDRNSAMRLAAALGDYWQIRGHYEEPADIYGRLLDMPESHQDRNLRARLLTWAGNIALARGRYGESRDYHEESVSICEADGNLRGLGGSMNTLGIIAWKQGDVRLARERYQRAAGLWADLGEDRLVGVILNNLGVLDMETGDYAGARRHYDECVQIQDRLGNRHAMGVLRANIGLAAMQAGDYDDAERAFQDSLALRRELQDESGVAHSLNGLGSVLERRGEPASAKPFFEESLRCYEEIGDATSSAVPLINLGFVSLHLEQPEDAATYFERALILADSAGDTANLNRSKLGLGMSARQTGRPTDAVAMFLDALAGLQGVGDRWGVALVLEQFASLLSSANRPRPAARLLGYLAAERNAIGAPRSVLQEAEYLRTVARLEDQLATEDRGMERDIGEALDSESVLDLCRTARSAAE